MSEQEYRNHMAEWVKTSGVGLVCLLLAFMMASCVALDSLSRIAKQMPPAEAK
jgi:hypothetical protein